MWMEQPCWPWAPARRGWGEGRIAWTVDWVCCLVELTVTRTLQNRLCRKGRRDRASSSAAAAAGKRKHGTTALGFCGRLPPTTRDIRIPHRHFVEQTHHDRVSRDVHSVADNKTVDSQPIFLSFSFSPSSACEKPSFPIVRALVNDENSPVSSLSGWR
ncbi:hypothetical protein LZ30DRAFT_394733 [Colletotrichum cereale]|nr:hypothetical protein LZ30DRAFT_394733 [Colletotrichum cereale]